MDCATVSIHFGAAFFWCLTLIVSGSTSFCTWHASRIYHEYTGARAMARGQVALLNQHYRPLAERTPRRRASPRPEVVRNMRVRLPEERAEPDAAQGRVGWTKMGNHYAVAAE